MTVSTRGGAIDADIGNAMDSKPQADVANIEDPDATTVENLVAESFNEQEYKVYKRRWFGLVSLCLLNISAGENLLSGGVMHVPAWAQ